MSKKEFFNLIDSIDTGIEDLKCCGNCLWPLRECYDEMVCKYVDDRSPNSICVDWQFDKFTKEERML